MTRVEGGKRRASALGKRQSRPTGGGEKRSAATEHLDDALGGSRTFRVRSRANTPFAVAALLDEVKRRLVSRGGRPADPSPTIRRLVPIKTQIWRRLQTQAEHLSELGKPVSPGQLAAMLLERSVETLDAVDQEQPRAPRD